MKPYNVNLNPIIDRRLEVERGWSMQSSAIEFLLENKFSIDSILKHGVQYLSREEEKRAIANAIERRDRVATHTLIDVKETEHESLAFLKAVRRVVDDWLALGAVRQPSLGPLWKLIIVPDTRRVPEHPAANPPWCFSVIQVSTLGLEPVSEKACSPADRGGISFIGGNQQTRLHPNHRLQ